MGSSERTLDKIYRRDKRLVSEISRVKDLKFRDADGTTNNITHPEWGAENQPFLRKAPSAYADGLNEPAGSDRPSARVISNVIFNQDEPIKNPQGASAMHWNEGQYIDHDITLSPDAVPDEPFPIPVPKGDPYFDPNSTGTVSIPLNRSAYDPNTGIIRGGIKIPREQINGITSYFDASNIYGSTQYREKYCRKHEDGCMLVSEGDMLPYNNGSMPNAMGTSIGFYVSGDIRANEHLGLTSMHTIWVRNHNYWAYRLKVHNPDWDDERLFQTARVIVEAEYQVIAYNEFLPLLFGHKMLKYKGYDNTVNAQIANEFAAAAFRFGHSMVSSLFKRMKENGDSIWCGDVTLKHAYFCPWRLTNEGGVDPIMRGLASTLAEKLDAKVINDLRNFLFGEPGDGGLDLVAMNIQRGRDHGLADYNTTREAYGLQRVQNFSDITNDTLLQTQLKQLYNNNVNNVDLWVGILCEDPYKKSMIGELGYTIILDQFERIRNGDRYWYQNRLPCHIAKLVKQTKLRDVILRNTDIDSLQRNVMKYKDRKCDKCREECK